MRFTSDAQRKAVFARIYPSWIRNSIPDVEKDMLLRYKNRLDANQIPYKIIDGRPVAQSTLLREIAKDDGEYEFDRAMQEIVARQVPRSPKVHLKHTAQKKLFSKMKIKDGYVSMVPFDRIMDPTIGLGYKKRVLKKWMKQLGDEAVPPLILRPSYMDPKHYTIWDGRHRYAVMEMQKWPLIPARIYDEGKLIYPKSFKRKRFKGDETKAVRLGEEYKYLW